MHHCCGCSEQRTRFPGVELVAAVAELAVDRDRVIAALRAEDYADAAATAEWMERYARGS